MEKTCPEFSIKNRVSVAVLLVVGALIWCLNGTYTFCHDDCILGARFIHTAPKDSLWQYVCYVWSRPCGYRPIVQTLCAFFAGGGFAKWVFDALNSLMLILLVLLICKRGTGRFLPEFKTLGFACALVWFFLCKGESYLWGAGSCNYLWSAVVTLSFLLVRDIVELRQPHRPVVFCFFLFSVFSGLWQESFGLPVCCALVAYSLIKIRSLNYSKVTVYVGYAVGVVCVVLTAYGRMEGRVITCSYCIKELVKCLWAAKCVWIVLLLFLLKKSKFGFIRHNLFELLVIGASLSMLSICGYNGERSIWIASIASIIIVLREFTPQFRMTACLFVGMVAIMLVSVLYGLKIKHNFQDFRKILQASPDGVSVHERVDCGLFDRFLFQDVFRWSEREQDAAGAWYYAKRQHMTVLSAELYADLYLTNRFCCLSNKLPISGNCYTTPTVNAIVMPISEKQFNELNVSVLKMEYDYQYPRGLWSKMVRQWRKHDPSFVALHCSPAKLKTDQGCFLLLPKEIGGDCYLKGLTVHGL